MFTYNDTNKAPAAIGPYSQSILCDSTLYVSGALPIIPETGTLEENNIEAQAERSISNIKAILEANDMSFENVIKTTCFIANMNDFAKFNEIYAKYFVSKPARSCIEVSKLPKGALCEIEVVAIKNKG